MQETYREKVEERRHADDEIRLSQGEFFRRTLSRSLTGLVSARAGYKERDKERTGQKERIHLRRDESVKEGQ